MTQLEKLCCTDSKIESLKKINRVVNETLNQSQITNCITEIPQDIKLELNNGVLTLKAGSKVYVPNGFEADGTTPKFDEVTVESDLTLNYGSGSSYQFVVFYGRRQGDNAQTIWYRLVQECFSGATAPTTRQYMAWYDTNTNLLKYTENNGATWSGIEESFPICIITASQKVDSIDQTFNGFGYIGSTVFVLPNVKGLAPNGRNEDGTLKNVSWQTKTVLTAPAYRGTYLLAYNPETEKSIIHIAYHANYAEADTLPQWSEGRNSGDWLNTYDNIMYRIDNGVVSGKEIIEGIPTAVFTLHAPTAPHANPVTDPTQITGITYKLPFRAVDYNDKSTVSGWAMPSSKYINLTVGASGTTYTAPANGLFCAYCHMTNTNAFLDMNVGGIYNVRIKDSAWNSSDVAQIIPVKKGSVLHLVYSGVNFYSFRFIYAEGEV